MRPILVLAVCAVVASSTSADEIVNELASADAIQDCVRDNFPESTSVQTVEFLARDRSGSQNKSKATIYWRSNQGDKARSDVMIRVSAPPKLRGTGVLMKEKEDSTERLLYLPKLGKVRRITKSTSSGSFLGTDFTYDDLARIQGIRDEHDNEKVEDGEVDGRACYVLEARSDESAADLERSRTYVDKEDCMVLKVDYFGKGDQLLKVLTIDRTSIETLEGTRMPRTILMRDVREKSQTELVVEKIEVGVEIPDKTFTRKELEVGRR